MYESKIESTACSFALAQGVFSIKLRDVERGMPDRLFLVPGGRPLFIEFKRVGGKVTPYQQMIHERLAHAGYSVVVCYTVAAAMAEIKRAMK